MWKFYDDGYNPANTVQLTRRLVEQDKVFATVGQLGTEHNLAVRSYLNQAKVPQTLVSTGASYWGLQGKEYPWTIGWQPDYIAEGRIYGAHIKANTRARRSPSSTRTTTTARTISTASAAALGKQYADANIVAQEGVEVTATSVASQMTRIRASGATIFVLLATPTPTMRAYATGKALGFNPEQIYLNSVSATAAFLNVAVVAAGAPYVNGSLSVAYLKDPANPQWNNDAAMKLYRHDHGEVRAERECEQRALLYGVAKAETFVQALYAAGKNPTRAGLMAAMLNMNDDEQVRASGREAEDVARRIGS